MSVPSSRPALTGQVMPRPTSWHPAEPRYPVAARREWEDRRSDVHDAPIALKAFGRNEKRLDFRRYRHFFPNALITSPAAWSLVAGRPVDSAPRPPGSQGGPARQPTNWFEARGG